MSLSGHLAATTITLNYIDDPIPLVVINLFLHPLLDSIPHAEWALSKGASKKQIVFTVIDISLSFILLFLTFTLIHKPPWLMIISILSGLFPDLLVGLFGTRWCKLRYYHDYLHTWPLPPKNPVDWTKTITGKTPFWLKFSILTLLGLCAIALTLTR